MTDTATNATNSSDTVLYEVEDRVAIITFNRPKRLNAWNGELGTAYFDALDRAVADPDVRVIVVTGAGKGWCAGADMDLLQGIGDSQGAAGASENGAAEGDDAAEGGDAAAITEDSRDAGYAMSLSKPVIAAVNGAAAGLGFVHAVACDLRFAAAGAKFTTSFARRGLIGEYGISWTLPRLVGQAVALDLLLSGRVVLAEEAKELGLVNRVYPPEDLMAETLAYARDLADNVSPTSMKIMKSQVYGHPQLPLNEAMAQSIELMKQSLRRTDFKEGVASFVEKRLPQFAPLTE